VTVKREHLWRLRQLGAGRDNVVRWATGCSARPHGDADDTEETDETGDAEETRDGRLPVNRCPTAGSVVVVGFYCHDESLSGAGVAGLRDDVFIARDPDVLLLVGHLRPWSGQSRDPDRLRPAPARQAAQALRSACSLRTVDRVADVGIATATRGTRAYSAAKLGSSG
jgi:hypothetical protein